MELILKQSSSPVEYSDAIAFMEGYVQKIVNDNALGCVWLLEHPALITAGSSARDDDLITSPPFPIHQTNRGGQYTYHGPGQRVVYVMLNLKHFDQDVRKFVRRIECWLIASLKELGVCASARSDHVGIWLPETSKRPESKIAAIGLRIRKWVSYHGIALNVCPNLNHFQYIVPCGIKDLGVTSLKNEGIQVGFPEVDKALLEAFKKEFGVLKFHET